MANETERLKLFSFAIAISTIFILVRNLYLFYEFLQGIFQLAQYEYRIAVFAPFGK